MMTVTLNMESGKFASFTRYYHNALFFDYKNGWIEITYKEDNQAKTACHRLAEIKEIHIGQ